MAPAPIDHLVVGGPDLSAAVAFVADLLQVAPTPGGRHLGLGTRNHLVGLGPGCYLEVIGPDPDQPDHVGPRPFGVDGLAAPALIAFAVRAPLPGAVESARSAGYDPGDAIGMQRATADGTVLSWRLTVPPAGLTDLTSALPFLIDWGATPHPSAGLAGVHRLTALTVHHPDVAATRLALAAVGAAVAVREAAAPALVATLTGPGGPVTLG